MNKKIFIPAIILIIVLAGGVLAWQFWPRQAETPTPVLKTPEEVVTRFFHDYLVMGEVTRHVPVSESTFVTEEYKQEIEQALNQPVLVVDPVIFAQDAPATKEGLSLGKATITGDTAFLIATLKYEFSGDHNLRVELSLINNQWKINDIILQDKESDAIKEKTVDWKTYRNEDYRKQNALNFFKKIFKS